MKKVTKIDGVQKNTAINSRLYVPADFDTNRKSLLRRRSAEKGLK